MKNYLNFSHNGNGTLDFQILKKRVNDYLASNPKSHQTVVARALLFVAIHVSLYSFSLFQVQSNTLYFMCYILMGLNIVFLFLNMVHEAVHENIFKSKKANQRLLYFFDLFGANSYIWKNRHNLLHHNYTNVKGWDSDIEQAVLFKIFPHESNKPIHSFQHYYFVLFYPLYIFNWIFIRDFKDYFSKKQVIRNSIEIPKLEYLKFIVFKLGFLFLTFILPWMLGLALWKAALAVFVMLFVASIFSLLVLLTPHVNTLNQFPLPNNEKQLPYSWLAHQLNVTNDVKLNNWFTRNIMGNFNFHVFHHLFPKISYIHATEVTKIIKEFCTEYGYRYAAHSLSSALKLHYQLLKNNGQCVAIMEEEL